MKLPCEIEVNPYEVELWILLILTNIGWWLQCREWERTCKEINRSWQLENVMTDELEKSQEKGVH